METKEHPAQKWEISIIELAGKDGKRYKVTRRMPNLIVAETKFFSSKEGARKQFNAWLE